MSNLGSVLRASYTKVVRDKKVIEKPVKDLLDICQRVCQYHEQTGIWPQATHPEFGGFIKKAKQQFRRIGNGQAVLYSGGYTPAVHSLLRKHGFTAAKGGGSHQHKGKFTDEVRQALRSQTPLTQEQRNELYAKYRNGCLSATLIKELAAQGITFT